MITLIRPILFSFLQSDKVKLLIVEMLEKLAESTDNDVDDKAVEFIRNGLFLTSNGLRRAAGTTVSTAP